MLPEQAPRTAVPLKSRIRVPAASGTREPLASLEEVAAFLGVPVRTVYDWRYRSEGPPGIRVGRHLRFRWADVDAWLDGRRA